MTFIKGFIGYFSSFTKIGKYGLVGYVILSGIISLVIALLVYSTIWQFGDDLGRLIFGFYPFDFGRSVIESVLEWLTRIVLWTLCFFTFKYLSLIILSPIMSLVSSKIEKSLIGSSGAKFSFIGEIIRGIRFNIRNLTYELLFTLAILVLSLILPVVSPFAAMLIFVVQAYYAGLGVLDYYLERHYSTSESVAVGNENRGYLIGVGSGFLLTLLVPFLGWFMAIVLGTICTTEEWVKNK